MRLILIACLLVAVGLAACSSPRSQRPSLAGTIDAVVDRPVPALESVALAPRNDGVAILEIGFELKRALASRAIAIDDEAPIRLVYGAAIDSLDLTEGTLPDIALGGTIGSEGTTDIGIGIGVPLYGGEGGPGSYQFAIEASLETRDATVIWRGRAAGAAAHYSFRAIVRTVIPLLLDRIGETVRKQPFSDRAF